MNIYEQQYVIYTLWHWSIPSDTFLEFFESNVQSNISDTNLNYHLIINIKFLSYFLSRKIKE